MSFLRIIASLAFVTPGRAIGLEARYIMFNLGASADTDTFY